MRLIDQFDSKDLFILKTFISHCQENESCLTSHEISVLTGRTSRTIKDDIKRISQLLEQQEVAKIVSRKGDGYRIVPLDSERYHSFSIVVQIYSEFYGKQNLYAFKRKLIILKILLAESGITMDKLSDLLFMNKTTLHKDMNEVKLMLHSWGVSTSSSSRGIRIVDCDEAVYRMLVIDVSQDFMYEMSGFEGFGFLNEYTQKLLGAKENYARLRQKALAYLREIDFVVRDYHANALALYVTLTKKRQEEGRIIRELPPRYAALKNYAEYEIAKKIFEITEIPPGSESEILSLAAFLLCGRDYCLQSRKDAAYTDPELLKECEQLYQYVISSIKEVGSGFWSAILDSEAFKENRPAFLSEFMRILVNLKYGYGGALKLLHIFEETMYDFSQMALEISRLMLYFIQKKYGAALCGREFPMLICLVEGILNQLSFPVKKKRIAVCSYLGRVIACQEARYLLEHFGPHISSVKVFNLYEIRKERFEDYDLIISDRDLLINKYPIPCVYYNFMDSRKESWLLKKAFTRESSDQFVRRLASITKTIPDLVSTNLERFFKTLSLIYGHDSAEDLIFEFLKTKNRILSYGGGPVMFIFLEYSLCKKEFIDVYAVKGFARYAFVVSLDKLLHIHEMKMAGMIFDRFVKNEEDVKALFSDVDAAYEKLYAACMNSDV